MKKILLLTVLLFALPVYAKDFAIENGTTTLLNVTGTPGNIFLVPSGGSVGIGTTVMSQLLTVAGNANITGTLYASGFFGNGENLTGIGSTNVSILYGANTSNPSQVLPARVSEEGNLMFSIQEGTGTGWTRSSGVLYPTTLTDSVGIGTASPSVILDVRKSLTEAYSPSTVLTPILRIYNTNVGDGSHATLMFSTEPTSGNAGTASISGIVTGTGSSDIAFGTRYSSTFGERMRIMASGNVGIGTILPQARLEVNSTLRLTPVSSATCSSTTEGTLYYDSDDKHFYGCNSTDWLRIDTTFI